MMGPNIPLNPNAGKSAGKKKQAGVAVKTSQISQLQKKHGVNSRYQQQRGNPHQSITGVATTQPQQTYSSSNHNTTTIEGVSRLSNAGGGAGQSSSSGKPGGHGHHFQSSTVMKTTSTSQSNHHTTNSKLMN